MITVDWIDFLKTGNLGGIHLGMPCQEVRSLLGKEEDQSVSKHPLILLYGKLEVSLDENRVVSISVHFDKGSGPIWETINSRGWTPDLTVSIESFSDVLASQGLRAEIVPTWNYPDALGITLQSGVSAWFERDGKKSSLHGLSFMDKTWGAERAVQRIEELDRTIDAIKQLDDKDRSRRSP